MYSTVHSAAALYILTLDIPISLRVILAILSHIPIDMIGEKPYKNMLLVEILRHLGLLAIGYFIGNLMLIVFGILLGNAFDIFDVLIYKPLKGDKLIHKSKLYPKLIVQLSSINNLLIENISYILIILYLL